MLPAACSRISPAAGWSPAHRVTFPPVTVTRCQVTQVHIMGMVTPACRAPARLCCHSLGLGFSLPSLMQNRDRARGQAGSRQEETESHAVSLLRTPQGDATSSLSLPVTSLHTRQALTALALGVTQVMSASHARVPGHGCVFLSNWDHLAGCKA